MTDKSSTFKPLTDEELADARIRADHEAEKWQYTLWLRLFAHYDALVAVADELAGSLRAHRADMHNTSNRPCGTCARSKKALADYDAIYPQEGSDA